MFPTRPNRDLEARLEEQDDLFHGQIVVIVARWFLIVAGIGLALWTAERVAALALPVGLMVALMVLNFYVHARYLVKRPVKGPIVLAGTAADLLVITLVVGFWTTGSGSGIHSPFFVFYYPVLFAAALVFRPRLSLACAGVAVLVYAALTVPAAASLVEQKALFERLLTLSATAGLGAYFWRIQRRQAIAAGATRPAPLQDARPFAAAAAGDR